MPKQKKKGVGTKEKAGGEKKKLYSMPEKIPEGTILSDIGKRSWRVGPSIGIGGFGEIYSACKEGESEYDYVVKCEPHVSGPLFVEMHFYIRNCKEDDLKIYQKKQGLKSLGIPNFIAHGKWKSSKGVKHRYIVIPRYGNNIEHYFLTNGRQLPTGTVYRLAIQMLDVYEYIHECGYVHADLKASNILMGLGKNGNAQAYLVDFGLASQYFANREYKPDPKKAHNGTINYTSRDAHKGVATMRSDLEILGYNLIQWLGTELPWVRGKLLTDPTKVEAAKIKFMDELDAELKKLFPQGVPTPIDEFMKYVAKLQYNDRPDYIACRKMFTDGLNELKIANHGALELTIKSGATKVQSPAADRATKRKRTTAEPVENDNDNNEQPNVINTVDDGDVVFNTKPKKRVPKPTIPKAIISKRATLRKRFSSRIASRNSPGTSQRATSSSCHSPSPASKKAKTTLASSSDRTPHLSPSSKIKFPQKVSSSVVMGSASTFVNNNITVKRKKKSATKAAANSQAPEQTPKSSSASSTGDTETPVTSIKEYKANSGSDVTTLCPRTPIVLLKKMKNSNRKK